MNHTILIFAEQRDGIVQKISFELLQGAKSMAAQLGGQVAAVLPGYHTAEAAKKLAAAGADEVLVIDHPILCEYLTEPYTKALTAAVRNIQPEIVLIGSTTIGMELAPRTAARLDTGLVTDCTGLSIDPSSGLLLMTRPNLDGISIDTFVCEKRRPQIATVRPGVLSPRAVDNLEGKTADGRGGSGNNDAHIHIAVSADQSNIPAPVPTLHVDVRALHVDFPQENPPVRILSTVKGREKNTDITQSRILAAGGRGVGGPEGFELLRKIARLLGGEIACSRACVESGWIDSSPQVGQTGKTVRPDLYLACGISGAFQHVTGMEGSKLIISINKNPAAPIFDISDLGIVGTAEVILPKLIETLEKYKAPENTSAALSFTDSPCTL